MLAWNIGQDGFLGDFKRPKNPDIRSVSEALPAVNGTFRWGNRGMCEVSGALRELASHMSPFISHRALVIKQTAQFNTRRVRLARLLAALDAPTSLKTTGPAHEIFGPKTVRMQHAVNHHRNASYTISPLVLRFI